MVAIVVSIVIGVFVGVLSGMLGLGGGMVMIPLFRLGYGMQAIQATATSLFAIVPTSAAGLVTHVRNKTCYPRLGIAAGIGGALTSPIGVYLATISPSWLVMVAAASVIAYSSVTMFRKAKAVPKRSRESQAGESGSPLQESAALQLEEEPLPRAKLIGGAAVGLFAGLAGGYVGVGGGFIMIPMFIGMLGTSMKKASGTSLMAICILAIPGVARQLMLGNVIVATGLAMAAGAIPGAILGANLMRLVPERQLRFVFAVLLLLAAVMLVVNELHF